MVRNNSRLLVAGSLLAMTAAERSKGRYMRAPDGHGDGGDSTGGGEPAAPAAEPEDNFTGEEVNDAPPQPEGGDEDSGDVDTPAGDDDNDGDGGDDTGADKPGKKKSSAQERIDELTAGRREAERAAAEASREAEYWRGLAEGKGAKPESELPADSSNPSTDLVEPDPAKYEYGDTDARYIADLARYETLKTIRAEDRVKEISTQLETIETGWRERSEAAKSVHEDFDEVVTKGAEEGKWSCSQIMSIGLKTSPVGAEIAYHLAKNPEESDRISKMHPLEQAKAIGRLEYRFETEAQARTAEADSGKAKDKPKTSAAPPPVPTARGAGGRFSASADSDDFAAFEARADQVLSKAR